MFIAKNLLGRFTAVSEYYKYEWFIPFSRVTNTAGSFSLNLSFLEGPDTYCCVILAKCLQQRTGEVMIHPAVLSLSDDSRPAELSVEATAFIYNLLLGVQKMLKG